ncbi:MAG: hypothetical protein AAFR64_09680 [Pseudomonadota bacterium]
MTYTQITASLAAGLALTLTACNTEPATGDAVGEMLEEVPAPVDTPIEATGDLPTLPDAEAGKSDSTSTPSSGQSDGMVSGSNEDASARKPDPKNSKLIKADPQ